MRPPSGYFLDRALVIGHRGAMGVAPENTLISFQRGLSDGVDILECDVRLSKDRQVVVIHDDSVDRTTTGRGRVGELTLAQLKSLDAGSRFQPVFKGSAVPMLGELLLWARDKRTRRGEPLRLAIEIKQEGRTDRELVRRTLELIDRHEMAGRCIAISFDAGTLAEIKGRRKPPRAPRLLTGLLYSGEEPDPVGRAAGLAAHAILPKFTRVNPALVEGAHRRGLRVATWVVDAPGEFLRFAGMGVDAIGTNFPGRMSSLKAG